MKPAKPTYAVLYEIEVSPAQERALDVKFRCAHEVYNHCIDRCLEIHRKLWRNPNWTQAAHTVHILNVESLKRHLTKEECDERLSSLNVLHEIDRQVGFTKLAITNCAQEVTDKYGSPIGSGEVCYFAHTAFLEFCKVRFQKEPFIHYLYGEDFVQNTTNEVGLRLANDYVIWGDTGTPKIEMRLKHTHLSERFRLIAKDHTLHIRLSKTLDNDGKRFLYYIHVTKEVSEATKHLAGTLQMPFDVEEKLGRGRPKKKGKY